MAVEFCSYEFVHVVHGERDGLAVCVDNDTVEYSRLDLGGFRCLVGVRGEIEEFDELVAIEDDVVGNGQCVVYTVTVPVRCAVYFGILCKGAEQRHDVSDCERDGILTVTA